MYTRIALSFAVVVLASGPACAQDKDKEKEREATRRLLEKAQDEYRLYFTRPDKQDNKTIAYWAAIKFEMDLGKFDLAALHLKRMLNLDPLDDIKKDDDEVVDKELIKIERAEGMSTFLRLKQVREWSDYKPFHEEATKNVDKLIDRVTEAIRKHLSNPERIQKFMKQLVADTEEERAFAFVQLAQSREYAVPYLIEGLRVEYGTKLFGRYREMLLKMGPETVPVYLEVFKPANPRDERDLELRLTLLDIIERRDDDRVVPYLWHLSAGKQFPDAVRKRAKQVLAKLRKVDINDLPPAKQELTRMANEYYARRRALAHAKPAPVKVYEWNGEQIVQKEKTAFEREEDYGLRYAREALDIDPSYQPAQIVLLSLMLERQYRTDVDQVLTKPTPTKLRELLTTLDVDLVMRTMDRAMEDRQIPVVLPLMLALRDRGEYRTASLSPGGSPMGVTRGLYYPDRRVQFAALQAMLNMPSSSVPAVAADRVVELARRFLAASPTPKALVAYVPMGDDVAVRQWLTDLGFNAVLARDAHDAVVKGKRAADFDLVLLHRGMKQSDFAFNYGLLRKDADLAGLPMVVVAEKGREKVLRQFTARDPQVLVLSEGELKAEEFKEQLDRHIKRVQFAKLSKEERTLFSALSMDILWRMAKGDHKGYHVKPALDTILDQLGSPDPENARMAIEILGRLPGKEIQYRLAGIAADPQRAKLRTVAAIELNRHMQANGIQLDGKQLAVLRTAHQEAADAPLREQLTITMSMIARPTSVQTGRDLVRFRPEPAAPPKEKEKEKEEK